MTGIMTGKNRAMHRGGGMTAGRRKRMRWVMIATVVTAYVALAGCSASSGAPGAPGTLTTYVHGQSAVMVSGARP